MKLTCSAGSFRNWPVKQVVVVVETGGRLDGPAPTVLAGSIRLACAPRQVAAVWITKRLPVDIRPQDLGLRALSFLPSPCTNHR